MLAIPSTSKVRTYYQYLPFVDPQFDKPAARDDMLIGCDLFPYLSHPQAEVILTTGLPLR